MDSSNGQNNKGKNSGIRSILAGIGYAVGALVAGIILEGIALKIMVTFWDPGESRFLVISFLLFCVVVALSIIAGIFGGQRTYERFSEKQ